MKQVWQSDPEFKRLSVPLSPEEERRLENSLVRMGTSVTKFAATRK